MKYPFFFFLCLTHLLIAAKTPMQEIGDRTPIPYHQFELPYQTLSLMRKFLPPNPVIVEAGAYDGKESCLLASTWPQGHVHCFEPVTELFKRVEEQTRPISNITSYQVALGEECGQKLMYLSLETYDLKNGGPITQSSSLYAPKDHLVYSPDTSFLGTEVVEVTTLDRWAEDHNIERVDLLWLDLQGFELPALKAASKILPSVSVIITEVEFVEAYEGQPQYFEVKAWLEEQGFTMIGGNFPFPKPENIWFGDALFVRKELLLNFKN